MEEKGIPVWTGVDQPKEASLPSCVRAGVVWAKAWGLSSAEEPQCA